MEDLLINSEGNDEITGMVAYLNKLGKKPKPHHNPIPSPEEPLPLPHRGDGKQLSFWFNGTGVQLNCFGKDEEQVAHERACARYEILSLCAAFSAHIGFFDNPLKEGK